MNIGVKNVVNFNIHICYYEANIYVSFFRELLIELYVIMKLIYVLSKYI